MWWGDKGDKNELCLRGRGEDLPGEASQETCPEREKDGCAPIPMGEPSVQGGERQEMTRHQCSVNMRGRAERAILAAFSSHRSVRDSSSMSFQVLPPSGHAQRFPGESLIWMQTWSHLSLPTDLRVEETVNIKQ